MFRSIGGQVLLAKFGYISWYSFFKTHLWALYQPSSARERL